MLALFLPQIALSDVAGMVARGEAVSGDEAERLDEEARGLAPRRVTESAADRQTPPGEGDRP